MTEEMRNIFKYNSYGYEEKEAKIRNLIGLGFDIDNHIIYKSLSKDQYLNTLFFVCSLYCKGIPNQTIDNIQLVLENGADINFRDNHNDTILLFSLKEFEKCNSNINNLIEFLIDEGADINAADDELNTPLHIVSTHNDFELIRLFLDNNNININATNAENYTPLMVYCRENENFTIDNFNYFISRGADINVMNTEEETLLNILSFSCNYEGAANLLERDNFNYNVEMLNNALRDVYDCGIKDPEKKDFIELLVRKGADINMIMLPIPDSFGIFLPLLIQLEPPENLNIIETPSNITITEGYDFYQIRDVNIDEFIIDDDNALVFYFKIDDNNFKTTLINKQEQLINGYENKSNIFYKCKQFKTGNNYKNNVDFERPYYKLELSGFTVYIKLKDVLTIIKSSHKFWIISQNNHDIIKSLCSRSNLLSGTHNDEGYALNYDYDVVDLVSGFHCDVDFDTEEPIIEYHDDFDKTKYGLEIIGTGNNRKRVLRKLKFTPFNSYNVKPTNRIVKNIKTPPRDKGSLKSSPSSSSHTRKRKTPSPPRKTKKNRLL